MAGSRKAAARDAVHVETTLPSARDARKLESRVLNERLAACAQRFDLSSRYWWKGNLEAANEILVVFKTTSARAAALSARILALHPYDVPYLRVERMEGVPSEYRRWLSEETVPSRRRAR